MFPKWAWSWTRDAFYNITRNTSETCDVLVFKQQTVTFLMFTGGQMLSQTVCVADREYNGEGIPSTDTAESGTLCKTFTCT